MSLEQYKDANRKKLWEILQIQAQTLQEEIRKNAELEKDIDHMTHALIEINDLAHTEGLLPEISLDRIKKRFSISSTKGEQGE